MVATATMLMIGLEIVALVVIVALVSVGWAFELAMAIITFLALPTLEERSASVRQWHPPHFSYRQEK
jgi:hypothetical protein